MSSIGRFLSRDAFSGLTTAPATLNRFTYALTNPVLIVDPSGFDGNNNVLQNTTPGKCAPPLLPAAMQMLFDTTFGGQSVRSSKQDQQLDCRPQIQCGGLPSIGFGCVAAAGWWGPPKPKAKDPGLQGIIDQLYRPGATTGNGGTADAIRSGLGHVRKSEDRITQLTRWLGQNTGAGEGDINTAQSLLQDLVSAMAGQGSGTVTTGETVG